MLQVRVKLWLLVAVLGLALSSDSVVAQSDKTLASATSELRVMTFNLWHGGDAGGQPLQQCIEVIRNAKADIVGLQETHGYVQDGKRPDHGVAIAKELGWHYFPQARRTGVLSRFPLGTASEAKLGVEVEVTPGRSLMFFNVHFAAMPYQPYQLLRIPYGDAPFIRTEEEAIQWAERSRGEQVTQLLTDMHPALEAKRPVIVSGDFNEPSFQDWTSRAAGKGLCPIKVAFPATKRLSKLGLRDAWRTSHPDEIASPGWTWTPTTAPSDPNDKHDRIDFLFVSQRIQVQSCLRVGEAGNADIVVEPWPSDHRSVLAEIRLGTP